MTLTANWRERTLYDAAGYTGKVYYMRLIGREGRVWDPVSKAMVAVTTIAWADSVILLIADGTTGAYPITIPLEIPASTYDVIVYERVGVGAVNTDAITLQFQAKLGGSIFGF